MMSSIDKVSVIRVITVLTATALLLNAFTAVFNVMNYTPTIVCLYLG